MLLRESQKRSGKKQIPFKKGKKIDLAVRCHNRNEAKRIA